MSLSVCYISRYVTPTGAGVVGNRGYELMKELGHRGHRPTVITSLGSHLMRSAGSSADQWLHTERRDGMTLHSVRTMQVNDAKSLRRMFNWVQFEWRLLRLPKAAFNNPDVVIVSSLSLLTFFTGVVLRRRLGARLVVEVRDIWPLTLVEEGGYRRSHPLVLLLAAIEREGYRAADAIVGTMPNLKEHVAEVMKRPYSVDCVPMGFSASDVVESDPAMPHERNDTLGSGKLVVGYAGTIGTTNALGILCETAERLRDNSSIHFAILGDGGLRSRYIDQYGHLPNLSFLPQVPKDQVANFLLQCDVLYLAVHDSNVWRYGQSLNKLIDYMLAGRPIVASYSGFPSMIEESGCGVCVPAGESEAVVEAILRYRDMPAAERAEMGVRGRDWLLERRSYGRLAADYEAILFRAVR